MIRQQIARLLEPSLDCAYQCYEELRRVAIEINLPALTHYYKLNSRMCDVMEVVLDKCLTPTTEQIMNLMEVENACINTNHPDFVGSADSLLNLFQDEESAQNNDEMTDENGNTVDKSYSLLQNQKKQGHNELDDFNDISEDGEGGRKVSIND